MGWEPTRRHWLSTADVPLWRHGLLLWRASSGDAKLHVSHFRDKELLRWDARQRIFAQAHNHISRCREFLMFWSKLTSTSVRVEDQDDFDNAINMLHRARNQTLLKFVNVARASYLKHDAYGHPLPDRTKVMIFPGHLENHIMAKTNSSRNFSDILEASQMFSSSYQDRRVRLGVPNLCFKKTSGRAAHLGAHQRQLIMTKIGVPPAARTRLGPQSPRVVDDRAIPAGRSRTGSVLRSADASYNKKTCVCDSESRHRGDLHARRPQ